MKRNYSAYIATEHLYTYEAPSSSKTVCIVRRKAAVILLARCIYKENAYEANRISGFLAYLKIFIGVASTPYLLMNETEDFLIAKTVPSCYFLHLEPTENSLGLWINFAHVTEVIQRFNGTIIVKLTENRSHTFTGEHAIAILDELQAIKKRYQ